MKKKIILLSIIGIYLTFALSSPIILAEETSEDNAGSGLFSSEIKFEVDSEIKEPIPLSKSHEITFKVNYKLNLGSIAKRLFFNRRIGRMIMFGFSYFFKFLRPLPKANLSISVETPVGCQAELDKNEVEFEYNNEFEVAEVKLTLLLDKNAPALQKSNITITANYPGLGRIGANSNNTNILFMPAYESNISIEAASELTIPPLKETSFPINITNNGNGESSVKLQVEDQKNWNITFDQEEITIDVGKTEQAMMFVKPPKEFDNASIALTFVPTSTVEDIDEIYRKGTNVDFKIRFYNDGSLKEEGVIDLTVILIIAIVIILTIILVTFILKKKK